MNKRIDQPRKANEFLEGQVAERNGAEEALRKSEAIARLVLDNLPAPAAYVDIHQTYQFVNKAYETWLGRPWDDIVGRHVCDVLGNKIYDGICSRLDRALAGTAVNFEMTIVLRGEERIIYTSYVPHTGKQGEIEGLFALITDITERKRAEETVRLSEARLKAILAHAPAEISLKDPEGRYILVNRKFAKRYSLNEEEVKGKTPFGILPDDLAQYSLEHDREVLETGKAVVTDHSVPSMDGLRPLLEVKFPIFDADGAISAIGSIATDISELKRAEEALRESEQRLRVIAEATPVPIAITRFSDGVVLYANPRVGPAFGLPPDEVVGRKSLDFYKDPADRRALLAALEERGYVDNHELELRRADGTTRSVLLSLRVITFEGEQAILFGLFDITERKRADEAARESETRVRAIVDNITDCVITIKENGRIQSFNAAAEHAFGYTADEVLGQNVRLLMAEPERKRHEGYIANYLRTGKGKILGVGPREVTGKRKDGSTVPLEITVSEMVLGAKRMFIGALRDITERKLTEQQLQQALKMEAVGQLTGGVAHDFNNLLTVILGSLQLLERCVEGDEQLQKQVRAASDAALRGAELTKRLLAFSRRQVLEPEVADLNKLVTGMDDLLRRTLGEAIGIRIALAGDLWWTRVDAGQLEVALLNLVLNARDAMPKGGKLTIETANARLDDEYTARYPYVTAGPYVMLAVTDSGTGMSAEVIERVFEPFFTTKETGKGTGLGLSIVYGFVKQSSGHVQIYSEKGHGTRVKVYLPKAEPRDKAAREEAAREAAALTGSETILVVEDEAGVREIAVSLLQHRGYRVLEAEDGPAALSMLDDHPDIDLLLTDVVMPGGMDGSALAREALKRHPKLKILYTSGYAENAVGHGGMLDEGVELISKPYQNAKLVRKVRDVLDS